MFTFIAGVNTYLNTVHRISMHDCRVVCLPSICDMKQKITFKCSAYQGFEPSNGGPFAPPTDSFSCHVFLQSINFTIPAIVLDLTSY